MTKQTNFGTRFMKYYLENYYENDKCIEVVSVLISYEVLWEVKYNLVLVLVLL